MSGAAGTPILVRADGRSVVLRVPPRPPPGVQLLRTPTRAGARAAGAILLEPPRSPRRGALLPDPSGPGSRRGADPSKGTLASPSSRPFSATAPAPGSGLESGAYGGTLGSPQGAAGFGLAGGAGWGSLGTAVGPAFDDTATGVLVGSDAAAIEADLAAGGLVPLGLNGVYAYSEEEGSDTRSGALPNVLSDLDGVSERDPANAPTELVEGLGLRFLRQPVDANVQVPTSSDGSLRVPVWAAADVAVDGLGSVPRSTLYQYLHDELWAGLAALFRSLGTGEGRHPLKVVLTTLTLGANSEALVDPLGEIRQAVIRDWSPDHRTAAPAATVSWYGTDVTIDDLGYSANGLAWDAVAEEEARAFVYGAHDFRSRYKLHYCYLFGREVAQLLLDLRDSLQAEATSSGTAFEDPFDQILALEIGNELDHANLRYTATEATRLGTYETTIAEHATLWARAVRETVRGVQEVLGDAGLALDLWLPSLSMYTRLQTDGSTGSAPTFAEVAAWQRELLQALIVLNGEFGTASEIDLGWFTNQDYHFYHYNAAQTVGSLAKLPIEVEELHANLAAATDGASYPFVTVGVSVCENGVSSDIATVDLANGDGSGSSYPYLVTLASVGPVVPEDMERLQARQLLLRLALASVNASHVAWHAHLGARAGGFLGTGVRLDSSDPAAPASSARKKLSWWALQRLARLVACSPDGYARSVLPARAALFPADPGADPTPSVSYEALDPARAADNTFVLEFRTNRYADYVYLIAVDAVSTASAEVWVWVPGGTRVRRVRSIPEATPETSTAWAEPDFFPVETVADSWRSLSEDWSTGGTGVLARYRLSASDDPLLLLSSERLGFGVIDA